MALRIFTDEPERLQKRWILAAVAIALFFHVGMAGVFDLYKIPRPTTPKLAPTDLGPFTIKQVEINPKDLQIDRPDPTQHLPAPQAVKPAEFNVDPNLVEKALQTPQPMLRAPTLPEPTHVVASTDVAQGAPYIESDSAKVTADISKVEPVAPSSDPVVSTSKMAQDLINSSAGALQPGQVSGLISSTGQGEGSVPGFGQLPPAPPPPKPDLEKLPEPILVRLPADVLFDFDSSQLKPDASALLSKAAEMIAKYPDASITVDGYSDSFGQQPYNIKLSTLRARVVQEWLQAHSPPGSYRFKSQGHGSVDFVVSSELSVAEQQPNRRVELVIQALKPQ